MAIEGKVRTLFTDKTQQEALFPRTKTKAVSDDSGVNLDALLSKLNSDLSNKASESFVMNKIAEAQLGGGSGDTEIDLSDFATKDDLNALTASDVGAVSKAGDTMTGTLTLPGFTVNANSAFPQVFLRGTGGNSLMFFVRTETGEIVLRNTDDDTNFYENFQFPCDSTLSANKTYNILTTKNPVTIAQGGTGVTTEAALALKAYPVGSVYIAYDSTSPASRFGGTWTQIKDRFLLAVGSTYTAAQTGGSATHTLTKSQIPHHTHVIDIAVGATGLGSYSMVPGTINNSGTIRSDWIYYTNGNSDCGGAAHNNMPPYQTVYMWRRTA